MASVADTQAAADVYSVPLVLRTRPALELSEDQFFDLCRINRELRIERTAGGELEIMPPAGWETGSRNAGITGQLWLWAARDGTGVAADSSGGYTLPNGATRGPDASWISRSRLDAIPADRRAKFLPACPDFVVELRSPSDRLSALQAKMQEYLDNGARLGWLLDPEPRHVYVYVPGIPVERLDNPETLSGGAVLPGFVLDLREIW